MRRESRPAGTRAAQNLVAEIAPIIAVRAVATVRLERFASPHDLAHEIWYRTAMLRPGTVVRLEVGRVWPPRYLPDLRVDLAYAIDTDRGDISDAWIDCLERAAAQAVLA